MTPEQARAELAKRRAMQVAPPDQPAAPQSFLQRKLHEAGEFPLDIAGMARVKDLPAIARDVPRAAGRLVNAATFGMAKRSTAPLRGEDPSFLHKAVFDSPMESPYGPALGLAADIRGFTKGAPEAVYNKVGALARGGKSLDQVGRGARMFSRAAGGAASTAPFAEKPEEIIPAAAGGAVLGAAAPAIAGTLAAPFQAAGAIKKSILRQKFGTGVGNPKLLNPKGAPTGPSTFTAATNYPQRFARWIGRKERVEMRKLDKGKMEAQQRLTTHLADQEKMATSQIGQLKSSIAQQEAGMGKPALQTFAKVKQQLVGEGSYSDAVYDKFGKDLKSTFDEIRNSPDLQFSRSDLASRSAKAIKELETSRELLSSADQAALQRLEARAGKEFAGQGVYQPEKLRQFMMDLSKEIKQNRLQRRTFTTEDAAKSSILREFSDLIGERVPRWAQTNAWYQRQARLMDEAYKTIHPRGSEYRGAEEVLGLSKKMGPVTREALGQVEEEAGKLGVKAPLTSTIQSLRSGIDQLESQISAIEQQQSLKKEVGKRASQRIPQVTEARKQKLSQRIEHFKRVLETSDRAKIANALSQLPFVVPTIGLRSGRGVMRAQPLGKVVQLFTGLTGGARLVGRQLTPGFLKSGAVSRTGRALFATKQARQK